MQTIVKLPVTETLYETLGLSKIVGERIKGHLDLSDTFLQNFSAFQNIVTHINSCIKEREIFYVKTFPEGLAYEESQVRHFICYGKYHRNNSNTDRCLFLRIDQDNTEFEELKNKSNQFKNLIPTLAGAIFSRPDFPEIILEQSLLNKPHKLGIAEFQGLYLFSIDYFGKLFFLDNYGRVTCYSNGQFTDIALTFDDWIYNEVCKFK